MIDARLPDYKNIAHRQKSSGAADVKPIIGVENVHDDFCQRPGIILAEGVLNQTRHSIRADGRLWIGACPGNPEVIVVNVTSQFQRFEHPVNRCFQRDVFGITGDSQSG